MARTYSADELIAIRDKAPPKSFDVTKINSDLAADIVKINQDHPRIPMNDSILVSRSSETTTSERCTVRSLSEMDHIQNNSDDDDYRGHPAQRFPRQWRLQKRGTSEYSAQPYSAPSGIGAQRAENFKKFYEAVVSPSHVRVTAGGRIVPNFRTLTQPMFVWNSERKLFEALKQSEDNEHQGQWMQGISLNLAGNHSQTSNASSAWNGGCGSSLDTQTLSNHTVQGKIDLLSAREQQSTRTTAPPLDGHIPTANGAVKLSPPSQFDASRPFLLNGQMVYAVPPIYQGSPRIPFLPSATIENSGTYVHQHNTPIAMTQPNVMQFHAANTQMPQQLRFGSHEGHSMNGPLAPLMAPQHLHMVVNHPSLPGHPLQSAQSSIMLSNPVALGHQIHLLQQQLKYIDNQLLNNKHQIDERSMTNQRSFLQDQISGLQSALDAHISQAGAVLMDQSHSSHWNLNPAAMEVPNAISTTFINNIRKSDLLDYKARLQYNNEHVLPDRVVLDKVCEDATQNLESAPILNTPASLKGSSTPKESSSRQRLRAAAAMAPPFQPRSQSKIAEQSVKFEISSTESSRAQKSYENCDMSSAQTEILPLASTENGTTTSAKVFNERFTTFQKLNAFPGPTIARSKPTSEGYGVKAPVPYLVGFPPSGAPHEKADSRELVYSRLLTEEEIRARYLYWGKAPYEATKGLPKFDGRDFYPPSPTKTSATSTEQNMDIKTPSTGAFNVSNTEQQPKDFKAKHFAKDSIPRCGSDNSKNAVSTVVGAKWLSPNTATSNGKYVTDGDGDSGSLSSWGLTRAEEEEIFLSIEGSISSAKQKSTSGNFGFTGLKNSLISGSPVLRCKQSSVLQGMLKNSPHTTMSAATGALSSATARGFLPPYVGAAAASLIPSKPSVEMSSPSRSDINITEGHTLGGSPRNENRAPFNPTYPRFTSSAVGFLQKVKRQGKRAIDHSFASDYIDNRSSYTGVDW